MAAQVEDLKWVRGTDFIVDGFRFQHPRCRRYFLTHAHSDHTTGLYRNFDGGLIYCTPVTAALLIREQGIAAPRIVPVPLDEPHTLDGVRITFMDANHCPGAAMILFEVPSKEKKGAATVILHTGDMRWASSMARHPALLRAPVDLLYLDTTYAAPKHVHPPQEQAIAVMVELMRELSSKEPRTLFVVGAYHIGKEKAYLGPAHQLGYLVYCQPAKLRTLRLLGLPAEDLALFTSNPRAARIHVSFMGRELAPEALLEKAAAGGWPCVVGFRPTGWTFRKSGKLEVRREGAATVYGIPYSEHSNYLELRDCVALLRPKRIIPTVNVTDAASSRRLVDLFADCMDLSADRSRLDSYFSGRMLPSPDEPSKYAPKWSSLLELAEGEAVTKEESRPVEASEAGKRALLECTNIKGSSGAKLGCAVNPDCSRVTRSAALAPVPEPAVGQCAMGSAHSCRDSASPASDCSRSAAVEQLFGLARSRRHTPATNGARKPPAAPSLDVSSVIVQQQWEAGAVPEDTDASALLAGVDVQEQACLMAMFEARWSTSREAASMTTAAACRAGPIASAEKSQGSGKRRTLGSTAVLLPLPALGLPCVKGKRQRTLLGFYSSLDQ